MTLEIADPIAQLDEFRGGHGLTPCTRAGYRRILLPQTERSEMDIHPGVAGIPYDRAGSFGQLGG